MGLSVPAVAVNFGAAELSDPDLAERVLRLLAQAGLPPERLIVEVLETVISRPPSKAIGTTLAALSQAGCRVDLDDFEGTSACISALRTLPVNRVKIDRSLVHGVEDDICQQNHTAGIIALAKGLGLGVLAEGTETPGEMSILTKLGCDHIQGFCIAGPMPQEQATDWIRRKFGNPPPDPEILTDIALSGRDSPISTGKTA